jgi:pimeloyl-ACP methyl ester carboxylesterase
MLAGMPTATNGEVHLYYETFGDAGAEPLLLVNGFGTQCIGWHDDWCRRWADAGFFVIRFDNRDVGWSTVLADGAAYSLADMAADAVAVLDAAGVGAAHVVGASMGGMIVQQLAIDHPERVRSLTSVMSTTGDPDVGRPAPHALSHLLQPPPATREETIARAVEGARIWGSPAYFDAARVAAEAAAAFDRSPPVPAARARHLQAIVTAPSRTAALGSVRVPALVMHGDCDTLVDPSGGRRTAEAIPGATFVLVEGMGHDHPPELWDRWIEEVSRVARRAGAAL